MSPIPFQPTFGERLAAKRKAAGLTQEQLGEGLAGDGGDLGKGAISSWESGRTIPSSEQTVKLAIRLKCSADELLAVPPMVAEGAPEAPAPSTEKAGA